MTENDRLEESVATPSQDISSLPTYIEDIAITHPGNEKMQVGDICSCDFGGAVATQVPFLVSCQAANGRAEGMKECASRRVL